jgi:hypothetical protein
MITAAGHRRYRCVISSRLLTSSADDPQSTCSQVLQAPHCVIVDTADARQFDFVQDIKHRLHNCVHVTHCQ